MGGGTPSLEAYTCMVLELYKRAAWSLCPHPVLAQPHSVTGGCTKTCRQLSVFPVEDRTSLPCLPTPTWVHLGGSPATFSRHPLHLPLVMTHFRI